jgi:hypothetical protein
MVNQGIRPVMAALSAALAAGWARGRKTRAAIDLALSFPTWRLLVRESGLSSVGAANLMADTIRCAG